LQPTALYIFGIGIFHSLLPNAVLPMKNKNLGISHYLRYVCFDPLGNWLLTGISNGPGSSSHVPSNTATSTTTPAPVTVGQQSTGITGIYRMERHEQERERHLQHRYQVVIKN
jgi:hypothetical protein